MWSMGRPHSGGFSARNIDKAAGLKASNPQLARPTRQILEAGRLEPLGFVYISPPFSTVYFNWFTGPAASLNASHGESMGVEGVENRVGSVNC
jgi:hypothetical protein